MADHPEIASIVAKVIEGDADAFGMIIASYKDMVGLMVGRYTRIEADREDLAQEVFIRAYSAIGKYRGSGSFEGWLRKIAVHTCLDWLRKKKVRKAIPLSELSDDEVGWIETNLISATDMELEDKIDSSKALEILQKAMEKLSPEDHLVIVLQELEGKSINEISEITGWNKTNVKVRAHRARERLRGILGIKDKGADKCQK